MAPQLSQFNAAWDDALKVIKAERGMSQQAVADTLGISRGAVQGARTLPKALGYPTVELFCEVFELDEVSALNLRWAWLEERITFGAIGASVRSLVDYAAKRFDAKEFDRVRSGMVEQFEAALGAEE